MIDEIIVLLLIIGWLFSSKCRINKEFFFVIVVMIFFLIYSLFQAKNVWQANVLDFVLFSKPVICFFVASSLRFQLTRVQLKVFRGILLFSGVFCIVQAPFIDYIYNNTTTYYQCCMYCGLNYLFFSGKRRKDYAIGFLILFCGIMSFRAKYFAELIIMVYVFFFLKNKIRLNLKYLICSIIVGTIIMCVNHEKIVHYLGDENLVRTKFYYTVPKILEDFFPLGPGFGTFNTEGAARYYSPLYEKYGFSSTWGARQVDYRTDSDFLRDTFYPSLSQFGFIGYILFFLFWMKRWNSGKNLPLSEYKFFIVIFFIEMIQNIAANAFTGGDGVTLLMWFGILSQREKQLIQPNNRLICEQLDVLQNSCSFAINPTRKRA